MILMAGPIDARESPTEVNRFAEARSIEWFGAMSSPRFPGRIPG